AEGMNGFVTKLLPTGDKLVWSSFLGGIGSDGAGPVAVGVDGSIYVAGSTQSADFPGIAKGFNPTMSGNDDLFVARILANGTAVAWSAFAGGPGPDTVHSIAVDGAGNVYIAGSTSNDNFPVTPGAYDTVFATNPGVAQPTDAFVMKIKGDGSAI